MKKFHKEGRGGFVNLQKIAIKLELYGKRCPFLVQKLSLKSHDGFENCVILQNAVRPAGQAEHFPGLGIM